MTVAKIRRQGSVAAWLTAWSLLAGAVFFSPPMEAARERVVNSVINDYIASHPGPTVPLVVQAGSDPAGLQDSITSAGGTVTGGLSSIGTFQVTVTPAEARRLNHDPRVQRLNVNAPIRWLGSAVASSALLNRYETLDGIPGAWRQGLDGSRVQVAVVDSGVWPHDDLVKNSSAVQSNQGNRLVSAYTNNVATDALDHVGHGTHVAGIIAGNGYDSGGQYIGVAPNAMVVSVKVADDLGNATEGDVITGLDWIIQANRHGLHIRIANLSLESTIAQGYNQSALDAMVEKLWHSGVVVVVAAGNGTDTVRFAPGNDPLAISVGSIDDNYGSSRSTAAMAAWSDYGTTPDGFHKPDVLADGSHVVSLLAPGSSLSAQHPANIIGTSYFKMGGTSMAAPQVAGLAALMLDNNPDLSPGQVKRSLMRASVPFGSVAYTSWLGTGGGLIDGSAVGRVDQDANAGLAYSQSYNPAAETIQVGGAWWPDATWPAASWSNTSWSNTSWSNTSWSNTSWSNTSWSNGGAQSPVLLTTAGDGSGATAAWANTSWSNTSWSNTSWSNTSWSNIAWSNTSWSNTSWSEATFQ